MRKKLPPSQSQQRARRVPTIRITVRDDADWVAFMANAVDALDLEWAKRHGDSWLRWRWPEVQKAVVNVAKRARADNGVQVDGRHAHYDRCWEAFHRGMQAAERAGQLRAAQWNEFEMRKHGAWTPLTGGKIEQLIQDGLKGKKKSVSDSTVRNYARVIHIFLRYTPRHRLAQMPRKARYLLKRDCPRSALHELLAGIGRMTPAAIEAFLDASPTPSRRR
jgi:hypothetical protein